MTPLQIEILLHYYSRPNDYNGGNFAAPSVNETIQRSLEAGTIVPCERSGKRYMLGERGKVFVRYLLSLELPTMTYTMQKALRPPPASD